MSFELNEQQASLKVTLRCENGEQHCTGITTGRTSTAVKCCMQKHRASLNQAAVAATAKQ
jgi:hypothetical protein